MLRSMARLANAAADSLRPRGPEFPWPDEGALAALAGVLNRVNPRWGAPRRKSP